MITVAQLAEQLDISLKEAVALCVVSGIRVDGPHTTLTPADQARVHDVLAGRVHLPDPKLVAGQKKPIAHKRKVSSVGVILSVFAALVLLGGCFAGGVFLFGRGNTAALKAMPGDCFDAELFGVSVIASSVKIVPCTGPHRYKAFGTIDLDPLFSDYPGFDRIRDHAQERCPALAGAAGATPSAILFLGPGDERAWKDPAAHKIICAQRDVAKK